MLRQKTKVVDIEQGRSLENLIKERLGCKEIIFAGILENGNFISYYSGGISDVDFVYLIQILKDRRDEFE